MMVLLLLSLILNCVCVWTWAAHDEEFGYPGSNPKELLAILLTIITVVYTFYFITVKLDALVLLLQ